MFCAHALAPFCEVLEDGAFASEVKPFRRLLVFHHVGDLQHERPAAAHGLRDALLQLLFPLLQRLQFLDGFLLPLVAAIKTNEATRRQVSASTLERRHLVWHVQENSVRSLGVMAAELGALVAETNHGSAQTIVEQK